MKVDRRYYCFGCGCTGDAIDFTAQLFDIGLKDAAMKMCIRDRHVASTTPYGYLKDKDDPNVWIVDEEAAVVVRRIFHMTMDAVSYTHLDVYKRQEWDSGINFSLFSQWG